MKRLATLLGIVLLGSLFVGCGGGIPAGSPTETPKYEQTDQFKNMMKTAGPKMQGKGEWVKKKGGAAR
jgi:hypothetical protein